MIETVLARIASFGTVAMLLIASALPAAAQFEQFEEQECLGNRALNSAIASGEVPAAPDVLGANGYDLDEWKVIGTIRLCPTEGGVMAYRIPIQNDYGDAKTVVLPVDR